MFEIHFGKRITVGFVLLLALLAWLAFYSYRNTQLMNSSSQWVAHSNAVLFHAEQVLVLATNIEIGQRGYSLTGNTVFLEPYNKSRNAISGHYRRLDSLVQDNPNQRHTLQQLSSAIDEVLLFSSTAIQLRHSSFEDAQQLNKTLKGKIALDKIRSILGKFKADEQKLLSERIKANEVQIRNFNGSFTAFLMVIGATLLVLFYLININLRARNESEQKLTRALEDVRDLYDNSPCGYHSLDTDGKFVEINKTMLNWLGYNNKEEVIGKLTFKEILTDEHVPHYEKNFPEFKKNGVIRDIEFSVKRKDGSNFPVILNSTAIYNDHGDFMKTRSNVFDNTARKIAENRIKDLNHELEAFTYSVSHDLRAPLRSIDGYARILKEDYNPKLDDEGRRVISVIMNNAKRMGQLIDDLLDFARLSRKEIARSEVEMTRLVKNILGEMKEENQIKTDIEIAALHGSVVDIEMIRQVWINLIDNAVKYSGKTDNPKIKISSVEVEGGICYLIKDNGVGFDMQYAHKLFGVFQRLHKIQEFNGTGVGLAIVKKIIDRHQGKVWGEGKLNEGATFYFTIPKKHG